MISVGRDHTSQLNQSLPEVQNFTINNAADEARVVRDTIDYGEACSVTELDSGHD